MWPFLIPICIPSSIKLRKIIGITRVHEWKSQNGKSDLISVIAIGLWTIPVNLYPEQVLTQTFLVFTQSHGIRIVSLWNQSLAGSCKHIVFESVVWIYISNYRILLYMVCLVSSKICTWIAFYLSGVFQRWRLSRCLCQLCREKWQPTPESSLSNAN